MKPLMSSCLTSTSCRSGLIDRICPVSSYSLGGGVLREHAAATASSRAAIPRVRRIWLTLPNDLGGHVRLQLPRMEGQLLSRHAAGGEDAAVLRGTVFHGRDQLHVLPRAQREDPRRLEQGDAGALQADVEGAQADHARR